MRRYRRSLALQLLLSAAVLVTAQGCASRAEKPTETVGFAGRYALSAEEKTLGTVTFERARFRFDLADGSKRVEGRFRVDDARKKMHLTPDDRNEEIVWNVRDLVTDPTTASDGKLQSRTAAAVRGSVQPREGRLFADDRPICLLVTQVGCEDVVGAPNRVVDRATFAGSSCGSDGLSLAGSGESSSLLTIASEIFCLASNGMMNGLGSPVSSEDENRDFKLEKENPSTADTKSPTAVIDPVLQAFAEFKRSIPTCNVLAVKPDVCSDMDPNDPISTIANGAFQLTCSGERASIVFGLDTWEIRERSAAGRLRVFMKVVGPRSEEPTFNGRCQDKDSCTVGKLSKQEMAAFFNRLRNCSYVTDEERR